MIRTIGIADERVTSAGKTDTTNIAALVQVEVQH
jgi:hypothetical protein